MEPMLGVPPPNFNPTSGPSRSSHPLCHMRNGYRVVASQGILSLRIFPLLGFVIESLRQTVACGFALAAIRKYDVGWLDALCGGFKDSQYFLLFLVVT